MPLVRKRMAFVVSSLLRDDLSRTSLLSIMQNLLLLMRTTLKLLRGFGTMSQSKLLLRSITATVTQVNGGLLGTNQASKSPLTVRMDSISLPLLQNILLLII